MSLFNYNNAITKVNMHEKENKIPIDKSNDYAKIVIENTKEIEKFFVEQSQPPLSLNIPDPSPPVEASSGVPQIPEQASKTSSMPFDPRSAETVRLGNEAEQKAKEQKRKERLIYGNWRCYWNYNWQRIKRRF